MYRRMLPFLLLPACFQVEDAASDNADDTSITDSDTDTDTDTDSDTDSDTDTDTDTAVGDVVIEIDITGPNPSDRTDECRELCFSAVVTRQGVPEPGALVDFEVQDLGYVGADIVTDDSGYAETCATGLPVGDWNFTVSAVAGPTYEERTRESSSFQIAPFGYDIGFIRSDVILDEVPWTPTFTDYASNPVLPPSYDEEAYDAVGTLVPTVVKSGNRYYMWFGGQQVVAGDYLIGEAESTDGITWTKNGQNLVSYPSGIDGDWKAKSTNSPMLLNHDGVWMLYYTGRMEDTGNLNVGLATSTQWNSVMGSGGSAFNVYDLPDLEEGGVNPVLQHIAEEEDWGGEAVAHPSVLVNDQGYFEMWYSTGRHRVGYALSPDGVEWEHYCHNPMFEGNAQEDEQGHMNWEMGRVKSTEVVMYDGYYMMVYTGGDTGLFRQGWAMSADGIHWARLDSPIIANDRDYEWKSQSVVSGSLIVDGSTLKLWYGGTWGTNGGGSAVGLATATLPSSIP